MAIPIPLAAIEKKSGFEFPKSYLDLIDSGATSYGKSRADWQKNWREIAFNAPPALLCSHSRYNVEWMNPAEVKSWKPFPDWDKELHLVAFAENGYGAHWCWCLDYQDKHGTPIALIENDDEHTQLFAADFQGFLFRAFVESLIEIDEDTISQYGDANDYQRFLAANLKTIAPRLKRGWAQRLADALAKSKPKAVAEGFWNFVSERAYRSLLKDCVLVGQVDYWISLTGGEEDSASSDVPAEFADCLALAETWVIDNWFQGLRERFDAASATERKRLRVASKLVPRIGDWVSDNTTERFCQTTFNLAAMHKILRWHAHYEKTGDM